VTSGGAEDLKGGFRLNRYGFRACLHRSGFTQKQLARELGVPYGAVNPMVQGGSDLSEELFERMLSVLEETDPRRLTEDWPLAEAAARPGIHHAVRDGDVILQVSYVESPDGTFRWARALELLARIRNRVRPAPDPDDTNP
jgi:transcriptional regulator with XRE-family HTH domain